MEVLAPIPSASVRMHTMEKAGDWSRPRNTVRNLGNIMSLDVGGGRASRNNSRVEYAGLNGAGVFHLDNDPVVTRVGKPVRKPGFGGQGLHVMHAVVFGGLGIRQRERSHGNRSRRMDVGK